MLEMIPIVKVKVKCLCETVINDEGLRFVWLSIHVVDALGCEAVIVCRCSDGVIVTNKGESG